MSTNTDTAQLFADDEHLASLSADDYDGDSFGSDEDLHHEEVSGGGRKPKAVARTKSAAKPKAKTKTKTKAKAMSGGTAPLALFDAPLAGDGSEVAMGDPDMTTDQMRPLPMIGGAAVKRTYHVLKVTGAPMPSVNAKYTSPTPSMALRKAASRIFRQSKQKATSFSVLMRRVSPKHADRELYEYDVTMVKRPVPTGFVAVKADAFKTWNKASGAWGPVQRDVSKNVRIVQKTDAVPYGYINKQGVAVVGEVAGQAFPLYRPAKTNTLLLVVPGAMPSVANGLSVIKTTHDVKSARSSRISAADVEKYDTAGAVRERAAVQDAAKKAKDKAKKAAAKAAGKK